VKDATVIFACENLALLLAQYPEKKECLITQHAIIPLMEVLEEASTEAKLAALTLINQVTRDDPSFQQNLALVGLLPLVVKLGHSPEAMGRAGVALGARGAGAQNPKPSVQPHPFSPPGSLTVVLVCVRARVCLQMGA
jgi:hypothetical protein